MAKTYCPACDAVINVDNPCEGAMIKCPECGMELETISTNPFEVDFPLDYGEDWDDEEEEDEE
jgi:lysine biosynthesis protein LysW